MFVVFFIVSLWNFVLLKCANLKGALQTAKITNREKRKRQIPRKKAAREKKPVLQYLPIKGVEIYMHDLRSLTHKQTHIYTYTHTANSSFFFILFFCVQNLQNLLGLQSPIPKNLCN